MLNYFTWQMMTHFPFYWTFSPNKDITKLVVCMSPFDQENMVVLYKFPKALYCKTLMDKSFSKTPTKDWDCEYLFVIFSLLSLLSYNFVFLFRNYGQV